MFIFFIFLIFVKNGRGFIYFLFRQFICLPSGGDGRFNVNFDEIVQNQRKEHFQIKQISLSEKNNESVFCFAFHG